ncbi:MAG: hypothetical protein Q9193_003722 [Seirophora villosa]
MSLDALEAVNVDSLSAPLLILERAHCDLVQFIRSQDYATASFEDLCHLSLDVGKGLGAVHSASIVHGDLKLENILIFEGQSTSRKWIAKLCDFGSAVAISPMSDSQESASYLGSETWLPPECYEKLLVGQPLPRSLVPCDIFVYGLVVWAIFVGLHISPLYKIQTVEGHGTEIVRQMGEQRFYARAKESLTACFSSSRSDIHQLIAAYTDLTFGHFGGGTERQEREYRQRVRPLGFHTVSSDRTVGKVDEKITRILSVLRACLNDSHSRRELQPWRYLDIRRPVLPRVDDPAKYKPNYERPWLAGDAAREHERDLHARQRVVTQYLRKMKSQFRRWLEPTYATVTQRFGRFAQAHVNLNLRVLQQRQDRDILYQQILREANSLFPGLQDLGHFDYLEHPPGGPHHVFGELSTKVNPQFLIYSLIPTGAAVGVYQYAWARLRSHLRLCCWREYSGRDPYGGRNAIEGLLADQDKIDSRNLAWLCRGEIGHSELQQINDNSDSLFVAWRSILKPIYSDLEKAEMFLLLFENGLDAHRILLSDGRPNLTEPQKALDVAVHFHRIASEEATSPEKRYFLAGRTSDLSTEQDDKELLRAAATTTALHDASKATNYTLVEFLVRNRFNVSARDSDEQLALDVATSDGTRAGDRLAGLNSIKALLNQNLRGEERAKGVESTLPLGWQETVHRLEERQLDNPIYRDAASLVAWRAYQETSIEGDFDAITFIAPKTGLYESDRLPLGRIQGEGQVYRLDPFRFLKASETGETARRRPRRAHFDEDWYREDIRAVEEPLPFDPLHDQRAWVRYPAQGLHYLSSPYRCWTLIFLLFAHLSLVARFLWAPWLAIVFSCVGIGIFSVGSAHNASDNTVSLSTKDHFYNLWGNAPELFVSRPSGPTQLQATTIVLSRGTAIVLALLWIAYLFFRGRSHAHIFRDDYFFHDDDDDDDELESAMPVYLPRRFPTKAPMLALVRLILLGFCADTLTHGLLRQSDIVRTICVYSAIPLTARLWAQIQGVITARYNPSFVTIESSFGSMVDMMLLIAPFLVLFGWATGSPMTVCFSLMEMFVFSLAVWISSHLLRDGRSTWFSSALLFVLYIMAFMGLWLDSGRSANL